MIVTNPAHPLEPLTAEEIRQAAAILRRDRGVGPGWRFASIELREPAKDVLRELETSELTAAREALVVCWDRADGQAYRARVSLTADAVTSWQHLPGQQPGEVPGGRPVDGAEGAPLADLCGDRGGDARDAEGIGLERGTDCSAHADGAADVLAVVDPADAQCNGPLGQLQDRVGHGHHR